MTVLPYNLAMVKPYESGLHQKCQTINLPDMTSDKPFSDIAERIRWHRTLEGLNQEKYAKRAGMKRSQLSNWEVGVQRISIDGAIALRHTYGLSLDFIYEGIADTLPISLRKAWLERPEVSNSK